MSSCIPPIPTELIEHIIDNFHGDVHVLKKCSLVARTWVPRSRKHLLTSFSVVIQSRIYRRFPRGPSSDENNEERTIADVFCDIINSPSCTFTPHLRCLRVDTPIHSSSSSAPKIGYPEWFPKFWETLNSKRALLNLSFLWIEIYPDALIHIPPGVLKSLTTLSMWVRSPVRISESEGMQKLFAFLSGLENLEELRLAFTINQRPVPPVETKRVQLNRLRKLHIRDNEAGNLALPWFNTPGAIEMPNLTNVYIDLYGVHSEHFNVETVQGFIDGPCRTGMVKDLMVHFSGFASGLEALAGLDLRNLTQLTVLDIRMLIRNASWHIPIQDEGFENIIRFASTVHVTDDKGVTVHIPGYLTPELPKKRGIQWMKQRQHSFFF